MASCKDIAEGSLGALATSARGPPTMARVWGLVETKVQPRASAGYRQGTPPSEAWLDLSWRWGRPWRDVAAWALLIGLIAWVAAACLWPLEPGGSGTVKPDWACLSIALLPLPTFALALALQRRMKRRPRVVADPSWLAAREFRDGRLVEVPARRIRRFVLMPPRPIVKNLGKEPASLCVDSGHASTTLFVLPSDGHLDDLRYIGERLAVHFGLPFVDQARGFRRPDSAA